MRALVITRFGGPDVLDVLERPDPVAGPGQLLVEVAFGGVNYRDIYERAGEIGHRDPPCIVGAEAAGRVLAIGEGVTNFSPGDRVAWFDGKASHAELAVVEAERAVPVPDDLSEEMAAAVTLQGVTAHLLSHSAYPVQRDDWVLVHACAGGVGLLLTQMAVKRGGRVIGTTSSAKKAAVARAAGAEEVIVGYDGFETRVRAISGGGVHVVYDGVGAATFEQSLQSLRPRGTLAWYGWAGGMVPPLDLRRFAPGGVRFSWPGLPAYTASRDELLARASDVYRWVLTGELAVRVAHRPLEEGSDAHRELESRRVAGKLLLDLA